MRATALLESDAAGAARIASQLLEIAPSHPEAELLLAHACARLGDASQAIVTLQGLIARAPGSALLHYELGRACAAGGRNAEAMAALECAVTIESRLAAAWRELAALRYANNQTLDGDRAYANFVRLTSDQPQLSDAREALSTDRIDTAEALLTEHLKHAARDVVALRLLAECASRRSDFQEAERILNECLQIAPGYAAARFELARTLLAANRHIELVPHIDRLLALEPDNIAYRSLKIQALRFIGRHDEAVVLVERTLAERPQEASAWLLYGHLMRELGERDRSIDAYRRAIAAQPGMGAAYGSLGNLKRFRFEAADIAAMRAQLEVASVRGDDRIALEFALGKALEDIQQYAESFAHYARGNALQRAVTPHNSDSLTEQLRRARALFVPDFFSARRGWGSTRRDPIFIVGLPRSGSTLLEQILSSHSQIEGTRELGDLPRIALDLIPKPGDVHHPGYPTSIGSLKQAAVEAFAEQYLDATQRYRATMRPRFVDKMLVNFNHVGLIHLMFPNAAIIDTRRHPLGCGFSCFKQLFARGSGFTYDLAELGRYYREYAALMAHYDSVLPGRVHRVYYEQLVAEPEREVRRLLEYCGLTFEEGCLRFYDTRRLIHTISSEQVREPIYKESVSQWRNYETWLGPLRNEVEALVASYPGESAQPARSPARAATESAAIDTTAGPARQ